MLWFLALYLCLCVFVLMSMGCQSFCEVRVACDCFALLIIFEVYGLRSCMCLCVNVHVFCFL
jgi:hypothetical protein